MAVLRDPVGLKVRKVTLDESPDTLSSLFPNNSDNNSSPQRFDIDFRRPSPTPRTVHHDIRQYFTSNPNIEFENNNFAYTDSDTGTSSSSSSDSDS